MPEKFQHLDIYIYILKKIEDLPTNKMQRGEILGTLEVGTWRRGSSISPNTAFYLSVDPLLIHFA